MNAIDLIAQDLFDKVRSRFSNLQMGDETGAVTVNPTESRFFDFDFVVEDITLGRVSVSINDLGNLKIYYSQGIVEDLDSVTQGYWYDFLREMRQFAKRRLLRFDTRDITKGNLEKHDFQYLAVNGTKEDNMTESQMYGSSKSSYRPLEKTLLIIRHNDKVGEDRGARSRPNNIKAVFIQNEAGERFKYPFVHLAGAKAMQRHVSNGGMPYDNVGSAIISMSEQIKALSTFKRQVGNSDQLTTEAVDILDRASTKLSTLRNTIDSISKQSHYEAWSESVEEQSGLSTEIDEATIEDYKSKFTISSYKEDLTQYFPLLFSIMQETSDVDLEAYTSEAKEEYCDACDRPAKKCVCDDEEKKDPMEAFEKWADIIAMERFEDESLDENTPHLKDPDTPAIDRKKAGYKLTPDDVKNKTNAAKYDFYKRRTGEKHPEDTREGVAGAVVGGVGGAMATKTPAGALTGAELGSSLQDKITGTKEGYYLSPEDLPDWTRDAMHRVSRGEVKDWPELYGELMNFIDDEKKAEFIAKRVWQKGGGQDSVAIHRVKGADMTGEIPGAGNEEDDDASFLNKFRSQAKGGSIRPGVDTGGVDESEDDEEQVMRRGLPIKEIAQEVLTHIDRETGGCPMGATGVAVQVKKRFGPEAGAVAEKLVHHLQAKYEAQNQMESMRRLAGLPSLVEAEKKTMSKVAKGIMKYGKKGMKSLADAGKKGKDLEPIRAKYNKYDEATGDKFNPLKHVKNPTKGEKTAAKDVKRGSYADRAAMLKSAEADGRLKK